MTHDELDTAAIRAALDRYPLPTLLDMVTTTLDLCAEVDRLRTALALHVDNLITGGGASARATGGVQPAPVADHIAIFDGMPEETP